MVSGEFPKGKGTMPGMDNAQKKADSKTFAVTVEDITRGVFRGCEDLSGPVVGNKWDADPLGEEAENITWKK